MCCRLVQWESDFVATKTIILLLLSVFTVAVAADEGGSTEADLTATTLAELGYENGYTFEGLQPDHEQSFHFPLPRSALNGPGELIIDYESSPQLDARSMLRVDINGVPKIARHLGREASQGRLSIPLNQAELQRFAYLNVSVKASLLMNGDRCLNDRLKINYLHLLSGSGLRLSLKPQAENLQEAWDLLPQQVRIAIPASPSESVFANALLLARRLQHDGKGFEFVSLPDLGELIIADPESLEQALTANFLANEALRETYGLDAIPLPQGKDVYLLSVPGRQFVVFSEPLNSLPSELYAPSWRQLALGHAYDVRVDGTPDGSLELDDRLAIPLEHLGLDLKTRYVSRSTGWRLSLTPSVLAGNLQPAVLHLEIVSSPSDGETPLMLQVFLNGNLQKVTTLPNDGLPNRYTVFLSAHDAKPGHNELYFQVQRNLISGDCQSEPPPYPVQITNNSYLVVSQRVETPRQFRDLHAWFADGFDLYVPHPDASNSTANLGFLANFFHSNDYPLLAERIRFYGADATLEPAAPFMLLGEVDLKVGEAGVRFDRGRIQVLNRKQETLLDTDRLPHLTISQLVQAGASHGLWVLAKSGVPEPLMRPMVLENNAVAFSGSHGVVLTLNPDYREVSHIEYPDYRHWFDTLGRYRYWLLALGWLLLTLLLVHLYGKARQHRKGN